MRGLPTLTVLTRRGARDPPRASPAMTICPQFYVVSSLVAGGCLCDAWAFPQSVLDITFSGSTAVNVPAPAEFAVGRPLPRLLDPEAVDVEADGGLDAGDGQKGYGAAIWRPSRLTAGPAAGKILHSHAW